MKKAFIFAALVLAMLLLMPGAMASVPYPDNSSDLGVPTDTLLTVDSVTAAASSVTATFSGTGTLSGAYAGVHFTDGTEAYWLPMTAAGDTLTLDLSTTAYAGKTADDWIFVTLYWTAGDWSGNANYNDEGFSYGGMSKTDASGSYDSYLNAAGIVTQYQDPWGAANYSSTGELREYNLITAGGTAYYNADHEKIYEFVDDTPEAGDSTWYYYSDGALTYTVVDDASTGVTTYTDSNSVVRKTETQVGFDMTTLLYDTDGTLLSTAVYTDADQIRTEYDALGNQVYTGGPYFGGNGYYQEYSREGEPVRREEYDYSSPDEIIKYYVSGVPTETWVQTSAMGDYTIYDPTMTTVIGTVVMDPSGMSRNRYDTSGNLVNTEYVINQYTMQVKQASDGSLIEFYYYVMGLSQSYNYVAETGNWYIGNVLYTGPAPVDLYALGLLKKSVSWYPNNTLCSFGPQFRDINPDLTDKWYMFTPIDLSHDGTQTFQLIASNMYIIGSVTVAVQGDSVTVDYATVYGKYGHVYMKSEYLNFFPDLQSVTTVDPEELGAGFAFGQTISIANDLGGDTNVLMFVRNVATYRNPVKGDDHFLPRYRKTDTYHRTLRDAMLAMMD